MTTQPGFFGKLPGRGDFVERRLAPALVSHWDDWLQQCIAASQAALGERWLDFYLTAPVWSLATSPGVLGDQATIGVMMPSVDKVGRYYPLLIAMQIEIEADPLELLSQNQAWTSAAEDLLLSSLDEEQMSFEDFDEAVAALPAANGAEAADISAGRTTRASGPGPAAAAFPGTAMLQQVQGLEAARQVIEQGNAYTVWKTEGSEHLPGTAAVSLGLPSTDLFPALLNGDWRNCGWQVDALAEEPVPPLLQAIPASTTAPMPAHVPDPIPAPPIDLPLEPATIPESAVVLESRSAGVTHSGNARSQNQDAWNARDDLGVWMVADGVGGHGAGELASTLAAQVLDALTGGTVEQRIAQLSLGLRLTQSTLRTIEKRYEEPSQSATTVVALLVEDHSGTVAWVGDSRAYRLRAGSLTQLMSDHAADGAANSNVITRAVGGNEALELDMAQSDILAGDRFLLCTDGVYRELGDQQLRDLLSDGDAQACCTALQEAVLQTPAKDNFTAVIIDCVATELPPLMR